jgi:UDP-N-acetylglucosamine 2-epimerase (non-hydrolysing)
MKIVHVIGARPNYMKVAPVLRAFRCHQPIRQFVIHTGQHYDFNMSDVFFQQLEMAPPDVNLQVGSGTHAQQTAQIMRRLEPLLAENAPDLVFVYGDVNSTLAASVVCAKLGIRVAHVEAGLRAFDRAMPEEINRILTDEVADLLFTPSEDGDANLLHQGIPAARIHCVGNVMIDTLVRMLPAAQRTLGTDLPRSFVLATLHRPSNVDDSEWMGRLLTALSEIAADIPVFFPVHPRTRQYLLSHPNSAERYAAIRYLDPLPYLEFLGLQTRAAVVITDSGGIQEETTFLGIPCLTVRENTERPVTVTTGTNILVGRDLDRLRQEFDRALRGQAKSGSIPPLWDGHAAERIAEIVCASTTPVHTGAGLDTPVR